MNFLNLSVQVFYSHKPMNRTIIQMLSFPRFRVNRAKIILNGHVRTFMVKSNFSPGLRCVVPGPGFQGCVNMHMGPFVMPKEKRLVSISLPHTHGYLIGLVRHLNKFPRVHNLWGHCGDRLFISPPVGFS